METSPLNRKSSSLGSGDAPYSPLYDADGISRLRSLAATVLANSSALSATQPRFLFNDRASSDFFIACEGREFAVHKEVLTRGSSFLKRFLAVDPLCSRINANNASSVAMELVLKSLYENPAPGTEFGAFHYNTVIVASVWEIAMHFHMEAMAAASTSRLIQLVDRDSAFRVLQATLKHPAAQNAKILQQHIVKVALPPQLTREQEEPWRAMVQKHGWLQDALDEISQNAIHAAGAALALPLDSESKRDHEPQTVVAHSSPTTQPLPRRSESAELHATPPPEAEIARSSKSISDSIGTIRESYQKYLSLRSASVGKAAPGLGLTPRAVLDATPTRRELDDYAADQDENSSALAHSTMKLRDAVEHAQDELVVLQSEVRDAVSSRRPAVTPSQPLDAATLQRCEDLRSEIEAVKSAYGLEMSRYRGQKAELEAKAAAEIESKTTAAQRRANDLKEDNARLTAEVAALRAALEQHANAELEAQTFLRDASVYCSAAKEAVEELRDFALSLPVGVSRAIVRKMVAGHLVATKEARDNAKLQLQNTQERRSKVTALLRAEEAAVLRLQSVLRDHDAQQSAIDYEGFY